MSEPMSLFPHHYGIISKEKKNGDFTLALDTVLQHTTHHNGLSFT
jgi:hypothetical protein